MKKVFNYLFLAVALSVGLSSCNNDDDITGDNGGGVPQGKTTYMELSFGMPKAAGTYADADKDAGTKAESEIKNVDIYIYDVATKKQLSKEHFSAADFKLSAATTTGSEDQYTSKKLIKTTAGVRQIFVGVNLSTELKAVMDAGIDMDVIATAVAELGEVSNATKGFAMFSKEGTQTTLTEWNGEDFTEQPAGNKVKVKVQRFAVKVTVQEGVNLNKVITGGTITKMEVALRNINKYGYLLQGEASDYKDPNWNSFVNSEYKDDFNQGTYGIGAEATEVDAAGAASLKAYYATENTSEKYLEKETTYASIRASFVPKTITVGTAPNFGTQDNQGNPAKTFYTVKNTKGTYYFLTESIADAYKIANGGDKTKYVDGYVYYNMFLNPKGKYQLLRNTYYKATITKITGLGVSEDKVTDPELPVDVVTNMTVDIDVLYWNLVTEEYELRP